ncbi:hypothetical protein BY996DRAFT_498623 [Phakopsora pachyrhizi]|uniref:Secreted protein n=1 Tax=Phakopsora pachyrhizi TaxID=170000 RepID=A0AAV0AFS6_PHAPC|nr:hypothetical protein BY996DRAFT_498623 [Phakopsora pachyrhizi]CAH7666991.1 hypothetical protein PPACK8108_LOCUS1362 [Phakopsora pachyrhizi]
MYSNINSVFLVLVVVLSVFSAIGSPFFTNAADKSDKAKCKGYGVQISCQPVLEKLWSSGKIKIFKTEQQVEYDSRCSITWTSLGGNKEIKSEDSLLNVFKKIDDACKNKTEAATWSPNITQYGNFSHGKNYSGIGFFQGKLEENTVFITALAINL